MPRFTAFLALVLVGCADLTMPRSEETSAAAVATPPAKPAPTPVPPSDKNQRVRVQADDRITASHVLIAFKGARRADPKLTRTKAEAKKLAEEVRSKAQKGEDFASLAKQHSDGPSAGKGGDLGAFGRRSMVKPFSDAAFGLEVGGISKVVQTEFGFHVIKRNK